MKKILVILKEPFLDRIPSLKTLLLYLAENGHHITLITSKSSRFGGLTDNHIRLKTIYVNERERRFEMPTVIKLATRALSYAAKYNFDIILGGDAWGNVISYNIARLKKVPYIFFALEFPQIIDNKHLKLPLVLNHENNALRHADYIITHDSFHRGFISTHFSVTHDKFLLLPNASATPELHTNSDFLRKKHSINDQTIVVLHSGGFGKWFRCRELIEHAVCWSPKINLIFHIGRNPFNDPYFTEAQSIAKNTAIKFSLTPLSNNELDEMISSADVGLALYSEEELGYRATLMGLAAGKIGNYLKCGLPIIATRLPSLQYIEDYQCGVLINSESEIEEAIQLITSNRSVFSENAYRCYRELWQPQPYLAIIGKSISTL